MKIKLLTSIKAAKKANACSSGIEFALSVLPKSYKEDKTFNLLKLATPTTLSYFFWAWRCTTKKETQIKRLILRDMIKLSQPIYENEYPNSTVIKDVVRALTTGKGLKEAANAANAAYAVANAAANAAANATYAAAYAVANAAYAVANAAAYAANAAAYAVAYDAANAVANAARKAEIKKQIEIIHKYLK